jgi:phage-related protein
MAIISSQDYFLLDGVSSATIGLYVDVPPVPPLARQRYTSWQNAIDGDGSTPDDTFDNITISFDCYYFFAESFDLAPLYAFLQNRKTLQLSRMPDRFLKIRQLSGVTPVQQYDGSRIKMQISFVCDPFKYHTQNPEFTPQDSVIVNPGTRYSRPLYHITQHETPGYGYDEEAMITVNGQSLKIYFPDSYSHPIDLIVDAERMIAYSINNSQFPDGENWTRYTYGLYPFLNPGNNAITAEGCSVKVTGNWRDY